MNLEEVERTPWVPFVGAHAGKLLGLTVTEYGSVALISSNFNNS